VQLQPSLHGIHGLCANRFAAAGTPRRDPCPLNQIRSGPRGALRTNIRRSQEANELPRDRLKGSADAESLASPPQTRIDSAGDVATSGVSAISRLRQGHFGITPERDQLLLVAGGLWRSRRLSGINDVTGKHRRALLLGRGSNYAASPAGSRWSRDNPLGGGDSYRRKAPGRLRWRGNPFP
jgi:hypothetical protein